MPVVALLVHKENARQVLSFAECLARAHDSLLVAVEVKHDHQGSDSAEQPAAGRTPEHQQVRYLGPDQGTCERIDEQIPAGGVIDSLVSTAVRHRAEFIVACEADLAEHRLLSRASPCHTVILTGDLNAQMYGQSVSVLLTDSPHDRLALRIASYMHQQRNAEVKVTILEESTGEAGRRVAERGFTELLRDADLQPDIFQDVDVVHEDDNEEHMREVLQRTSLVLTAPEGIGYTAPTQSEKARATVALVKRAPPIRVWTKRWYAKWSPHLNPAGYADLVQSLRRGSRCDLDFVMMLGLASAIATLGLLQDSPAVVIGSMLLAPLMTPMLGAGLSLAQASPRLAKTCLTSISTGAILTLTLSVLIGWITPGNELTSQVLARGNPNLLDLFVATFSAAAAAYAMARPGLLGTVAGVAIATALVPPLCAAGVAIAYRQPFVAVGALSLFLTNLVAIVLTSALMFHGMGVTAASAPKAQRRWVAQALAGLACLLLILAFPLGVALERQIDAGKPQLANYPLTKASTLALLEVIHKYPQADLLIAGRPSNPESPYQVIVFVGASGELPSRFSTELTEALRNQMQDEELTVRIIVIPQVHVQDVKPE